MPIPVSVGAFSTFGFLLQSNFHISSAQSPYGLCGSLLSLIYSTCIQFSLEAGLLSLCVSFKVHI